MGRGLEGIERLRGQIEHWRTTRDRRCAMPQELWKAAVGLAKEQGIYQVAKVLNLNSGNLKKRVESSSHKRGDAAGENGFGFVELEGIKLEGMKAAPPLGQIKPVFWRGDLMDRGSRPSLRILSASSTV